MWVDFHWHARDFEQSHKETVSHSLQLAEAAGLDAIAAMPNTATPLISMRQCQQYLALARAVRSPVHFFVHIGVTANPQQIREAVKACQEEPGIIGMKVYWGKSTGNLGVVHPAEQLLVLKTLAECNYKGVLAMHCEKESEMHDQDYQPSHPVTWSTVCRPEKAEIMSVREIISMAESVQFPGKLHVAHVSTLPVVDFIATYQGPLKLSCGVTPHHVMFNYATLDGKKGAWYKCNPPLRSEETRLGLLQRLITGKIPIIESDHAPHTEEDKAHPLPASGITNGFIWPQYIAWLRKKGMKEDQIMKAAFWNAVKLYGLPLQPRQREIHWQQLEKLKQFYPLDVFKTVV